MKKILLAAYFIVLAFMVCAQVPVVSGGVGQTDSDPNNMANGGAATGLGCGGGGANWYGGNGGAGKYGGGGGGAAGYSALNMAGGAGGQGVVVVAFYNGATLLNTIVYNQGSSLTIPAGVNAVKVWAIGAGGGGAGATDQDNTSGGGGGAGGTAWFSASVSPGNTITYVLGTPGAGGIDVNNGSDGGNTQAVVAGTTITGNGGGGGQFNSGADGNGGSYSGGTGGSDGGLGSGISNDNGGGGGGGIGGVMGALTGGADGADGANAGDVSGLFAALASANLLPVVWESFTVKNLNNTVLLQWVTAAEQNNLSFTVQHSTDSRNFNDIATVAAAGNSTVRKEYQYTDLHPVNGSNFYRLLQIDNDGKNSFSVVKQLFYANAAASLVLLTNPAANGNIQLQLKADAIVALYDANGKQVYRNLLQKGLSTIYTGDLSKGIYILQSGNETRKVVIQ